MLTEQLNLQNSAFKTYYLWQSKCYWIMEDFIYEETKYIKRKDLKDYDGLMSKYDYAPHEIEDDTEFNIVFQYLENLTRKAPEFIKPYETLLAMVSIYEPNPDLLYLKETIEGKWVKACEKIADRENIFDKKVEWGWMENRPLIRGLFHKANVLWQEGEIEKAHELFSKIYKTNENDNIGARYSVKATSEGMTYDEFEDRFTHTDEYGSFFKNEELWEWYGEEN